MPGTVVTVDDLTESVNETIKFELVEHWAAAQPFRDGVRGAGKGDIDRTSQPPRPWPVLQPACPMHPTIIPLGVRPAG